MSARNPDNQFELAIASERFGVLEQKTIIHGEGLVCLRV